MDWCSVYLTPQGLPKYIYLSPPLIFPTTYNGIWDKNRPVWITPGAAPIRWMGPIRNPRWEQKRTEGYVIVSTVHRIDSLAHMLIVFHCKSSLIHFDKIKFLSQLHICIILLYLIFYFSKFMFKSWLVAHENWVSVGSFLVPGNCKNAGFCTIYPRASGGLKRPQTPCRKATSARWGRS